MTRTAPVIQLCGHNDLLASAAAQIIDQAGTLPNLTQHVVLLPELIFAADLRRQLLQAAAGQGFPALLGPHISTPEQWLATHAVAEAAVPGRARRELMLVEAIRQHPGVFGSHDPWQLAASLITLFDELTLQHIHIPAELDAFTAELQTAYGIKDKLPEPLGMEARIVHSLWQAWHIQLQEEGLLDPGMAMLQCLARHQAMDTERQFWFVGFDDMNALELDWVQQTLQSGNGHCILPRPLPLPEAFPPPSTAPLLALATPAAAPAQPLGTCLDAAFTSTPAPLAERARQLSRQQPHSPLVSVLRSFAASSAEQEARAIDLQVRRWLIDGHQPIGIVTEDRRLGRRVRALLERAGITLQDPGGWALSTTSAAAALERWLQTVEEDFAHEPLLDVLKSVFIFPDEDREQLANTVYRFETDIIQHENIARGLQRYRHQISTRLEHLKTRWSAATAERLRELLNVLDQAADPLRDCLDGEHTPVELLTHLRTSLQRLGIWQSFEGDPAGQRILHEWRLLRDAAQHSDVGMNWSEFRRWLGSALERHDFKPSAGHSPVLLLNLQQARLGRFAGLIIGACDSKYLPVTTASSPFFNDPVRGELGLPVWSQRYRTQLDRFRNLLESAPRVLLTWHREDKGEIRRESPWLALIETFQQLAWQTTLHDDQLEQLLEQPGTRVAGNHPLALPGVAAAPRPTLPAARLPAQLSVSAHTTLIDCPYRFFAASGLKLKAREEVRRELEKAEYGTLVHRSLEIFHQGGKGYPAPFSGKISADNQAAAIAQLEAVSRQVFGKELEDNFENRAWLRRWLVLVPLYIEWQGGHQADWTFADGECSGELELLPGVTLKGRLDRMDSGPRGELILDYKTGRFPKQDAIDSGEAVQLPSYALLAQRMPARVEYVQLDGKVCSGSALEGEALTELTQAVHARLVTLLEQLATGAELPAWGDDDTCAHCDMDGLCRKQAWPELPR
jgi:ATP-dependent helicase/nuclease subunit B